jgi:hypothetical protein
MLESIVLAVLLAGGLALLVVRVLAFVARGDERGVDAALSCPRTGAKVRCTLVYDQRRHAYTDVLLCSAHAGDPAPPCQQDCRRLLNLGIPLRIQQPLAEH